MTPDQQSMSRLANAVLFVEQMQSQLGVRLESAPLWHITITGAADGSGEYPGKITIRDTETNTWVQEEDFVRVIPLNTETYGTGTRILCRYNGMNNAGTFPLYVPSGGTGNASVAPCIANIALIPYFTSLECSGPDQNQISKMTHIAVGTGCGVFTGYIQVSGRVLDSESKGVSGVTISNSASGSPITVATTASDGTWSGSALIAVDNTGPAPAYFVEISAAGGTPSSIIYNNNPGPITGVNFTV